MIRASKVWFVHLSVVVALASWLGRTEAQDTADAVRFTPAPNAVAIRSRG